MEIIRTWLLSVTVSAMVIAAALMPAGAVKRVGKLTGGLILVLGILQPLVTMDYEDLYDMVSSLPAGAISQETLEEKTYEPMKGIIEEELSAYIVDKGEQLGASGGGRASRSHPGHRHRPADPGAKAGPVPLHGGGTGHSS